MLGYVQDILAQDSVFYQNAEWSPDGKKICVQAIMRSGSDIHSDGYIIDLAHNSIERKIPGAFFPSWSRDGKFVAYSKRNSSSRGSDIWLMNSATGDTIRLTHDTARTSGVSFSPDGKRMCFSSDKGGGQNLYVMNSDGSHVERITFDTARYFNPVWSPKGDMIVYYRELGDRRDKVYALNLKDRKEKKVTDDTLHNTFPGWLPDGYTISYTMSDLFSKEHVPSQVALIDADGHNMHIIKNTAGYFCSRVSPDGKKIAAIKGHWPASDVYIANIDGSDPVCVTCNLLP